MPRAKNRRDQEGYIRTSLGLSDPDWTIVVSQFEICSWSELLFKDQSVNLVYWELV